MGDKGAVFFAETLSRNRCLLELHLGYNGITDVGAAALVDAISHPENTLNVLDLTGNQLNEGAVHRSNGGKTVSIVYT